MRIWQLIYNALEEELIKHREKIICNTPIEYEHEFVDRKAELADRLFNISDEELIRICQQLKELSE